MARSRNIKHGFFTNDELAEVPALGRLVFIGLWTIADREGRLEDRPKRIKAEILPYDDVDPDALLQALADRGFLVRYEVNGSRFIQIVNFAKHQNPHVKEGASTIPAHQMPCDDTRQAPDKHQTSPVQASGMDGKGTERATLIPDSGFLIPDCGEEKESRAKPRSTRSPKTSPPEDFCVSDAVKKWASEKGYGQLEDQLQAFLAKCKAHDYRYVDWDAAFREAVREDWGRLRTGKALKVVDSAWAGAK